MIIDAHNHPDWAGHNLTRFLDNMDALGIDKTWILPREIPLDEIPPTAIPVYTPDTRAVAQLPFSRCLSYVERAPDRFVLGFAPDPRRAEAVDLMSAAIDIYDARVCGEIKLRMMYDNPDALRLFRFCGEKGVPVILHLQYPVDLGTKYPRSDYWYGGSIDSLERVLQACPETTIIGHAPGFWAHISGDVECAKSNYPKDDVVPGGKLFDLLRTYPNLYCDLSAGSAYNALTRNEVVGREFLLEFQDRVLYARDCFKNMLQELLNRLDLPPDVLAKIYAGNALRLVPLV